MSQSQNNSGSFSDFEREAIQARAKELREEAKQNKSREKGEKVVLEAISKLVKSDQELALKIHEIVKETTPDLIPKTWYGMPAYADKDGKVLCFFTGKSKFDNRYATFGFNDNAKLDEGNIWPTSFGLTKITEDEENQIKELLKKALG